MKKTLGTLLVVAVTTLSSCSKEEDQPAPAPQSQNNSNRNCNCGMIMSDDVADYSVVVKNNCSGNIKKVYLAQADWMLAYVGSEICLTNVSSWKN